MQQIIELSPSQNVDLRGPHWVVVVGAGTGGPQALAELLPQFSADFPGTILVVQQMRPGFTRVLAAQLSHLCKKPVHEPVDGQSLSASKILMAPTQSVVTLARAGGLADASWEISIEEIGNDHENSASRINATMTSVAQAFGRNTVGVVLTGKGEDGCEGLRSIANAGGITMAQDAASSAIFDMPSRAIDAGVVGDVLPPWSIGSCIVEIVEGTANANAA